MNINLFFFFVLALIISIYIFFKPLALKEQTFTEMPIFELREFTLHELNTTALTTYMYGATALKYKDRYEVNNFFFIDNAKKYIAKMKADKGIYNDPIVTLHGDIEFVQKDGITFQTQDAIYDKRTKLLRAKGKYLLFKDKNKIIGRDLYYYNEKNIVQSKDIEATYQLKESF